MKHVLIAATLLLCCMRSRGQHYISWNEYFSLIRQYERSNDVAVKTRVLDRFNQGTIVREVPMDAFFVQYLTQVARSNTEAGRIAALRLRIDEGLRAERYEFVLQELAKLTALFDARHDTLDIGSPLRIAGLMYMSLGRHKDRMAYYEDRLAHYARHGPAVNLAICYHGIAGCHLYFGDLNQAISNFLKAAEIARTFSPYFYKNELYGVAALYGAWGNTARARHYYSLMRQQPVGGGDSELHLSMYRNLAELDLKAGDYRAALLRLDTGAGYAQVPADSAGLLRLDLLRAEAYIGQGRLDSAAALLRAVTARNTYLNVPITNVGGNFELNHTWYLYLKARHDDYQASAHLEAALQDAEQSRMNYTILKYRRELALHHRPKNPALALKYAVDYIRLQDSLTETAGPNNIAYYESVLQEKAATRSIDSLKEQRLRQEIQLANRRKIQTRSYTALALLGLLAASLLYFYRAKARDNRAVRDEKQRSDALLLNILPAEVAEELKAGGVSAARQYDEVSVLFTDFVNFTSVAESLSPQALVQELNAYFTAFDAIMERNGLERIKTIGDAYMAVCGLPVTDPQHAERCVQAALEVRDFVGTRLEAARSGHRAAGAETGNSGFNIRIGIHSGPVVAGIVGVKKFAYDIWGDTVNTAARMEQSSEPGRVNISRSTYELVKDRYPCSYRGKVAAKNKGEMEMYFVEHESRIT